MIDQIGPDLFVCHDSCEVYLIRRGDRAMCVDFGTGEILKHLDSLGVQHLDWIVHTHHHRDQCQGDKLAVERGTHIAAPEWEAHYFLEAEHFWGRRRIFHLYNMRTNWFALRESVPVDHFLQDFTTFTWEDVKLEICPAPGHTRGSVALVWKRDDGPAAFVGDLIRDDGRTETVYDLAVGYAGWEGMQETILSLGYLSTFSPSILYPSHGTPVEDPASAMPALQENLRAWLEYCEGSFPADITKSVWEEVHPQVYRSVHSNCTHWAILSRSGKAMLIDYGNAYGLGLLHWAVHPDESNRFMPHSLEELRALGMTSVDVAMPTHCHDDHVAGFAWLQRKHGARVWCLECMADALEQPTSQVVGCTCPSPLSVERRLIDGETFTWEEFAFTVRHTPGHADQHMTILLDHAGKRLAFVGDLALGGSGWNLIPLNRNRPGDHARSAEILIECAPDMLCPGHGKAVSVDGTHLERFRGKVAGIPEKLRPLVGNRDLDRAMAYHWAEVTPYEQPVQPGQPFRVTVSVRNYEVREVQAELTPALPAGWTCDPPFAAVDIPPGELAQVPFVLTPCEKPQRGPAKVPFAFDLKLDGRPLGEACNGVANYIRYPYHGKG